MPPASVTIFAAMAVFYLATVGATILRLRRSWGDAARPLPRCSVLLPVKGASPYLASNVETLALSRALEGEILLCVARADDPAHAVLAPLAARYPGRLVLLVGEAAGFANPKLRNVAKGYAAAREDVLLCLDDNVAMEPRLLAGLLGALGPRTAAATAAPIGRDAAGLPAEIEAATCNGYLYRLQSFLALFNGSAAFGNALAFRKADLDAEGGLAALTEGPCEDNAASKALRRRGRLVLIPVPVARRIGRRTWREVWQRHLRWTACGKCHDPELYLVEPLAGGVAFTVFGGFALMDVFGLPWLAGAGVAAAAWYGIEAGLNVVCRWPVGWRAPLAWVLRDILLPATALVALVTRRVPWRGEIIDMPFRWPWARRKLRHPG